MKPQFQGTLSGDKAVLVQLDLLIHSKAACEIGRKIHAEETKLEYSAMLGTLNLLATLKPTVSAAVKRCPTTK